VVEAPLKLNIHGHRVCDALPRVERALRGKTSYQLLAISITSLTAVCEETTGRTDEGKIPSALLGECLVRSRS
jgi:hypothetical protein